MIAALALLGCEERQPLDPGLARIRRAAPATTAAEQPATYLVSPESQVSFGFRKRDTRPTGTIGGLTGKLLVDLHHLAATRGTLQADLGTLTVDAPASEQAPEDPTATALAWLGAAPGLSIARRADARRVRLDLHTVGGLSADEAYAGRRESAKRAANEPDDDGDGEIRRVDFTASGDLTLNARRAAVEWDLTARFEYPAPALSGVAPTRIVIETRRPARIVLRVFDILPRNANGTTLWAEGSAARKHLGHEAYVSARLVLEAAQ